MSLLKKDNYFTSENKTIKVEKWSSILNNYYSKKKKISFQLQQSALLVIDMQNYFLDTSSHAYIPSSEIIIKPIEKLINIFQRKNRPIIFTQYGISNNKIKERTKMREWWGEELTFDNPLSEIYPSINTSNSIIIKKTTYDAFIGTDLQKILEENKINQLIITGVITHLCCETTARSAFCRNFTVWMVIDCLASHNEELHLSSLKAASHGFAIPITSDKLLEKMENE